jgi:hypothetical protein
VKRGHWRRRVWLLSAAVALSAAPPVFGWVYPEHRDIAVLAVQGLDTERKTEFDELWQDARHGDEGRLCAQGADLQQGLAPSCLDWAALSAIAGDHSCSSAEMLQTVRKADWILVVADIAARLKEDLARIPVTASAEHTEQAGTILSDTRRRLADEASRAERLNVLRTADTRLAHADPEYATRAQNNFAHFMLPRPDTKLDLFAYSALAVRSGSRLNAMGVYAWYHLSALQKASRLADDSLSADERRALARTMLSDEAFALHFLEDIYAAGHIAGTWGDVSQRKGTHDYYSENGLEVFTWAGRDRTFVLMGDAHMRPEDAALASSTVRISLEQVLDAARGRSRGYSFPRVPTAAAQPEDLDICNSRSFPDRDQRFGGGLERYRPPLEEALLPTPVPGLGPGLGAQPRARSEVGPFVGLAAAIEGRAVNGGFEASENGNGFIAGLDLGIRAGVGLEGAFGDSGDGRVFAQLGFHSDGGSTNSFSETSSSGLAGNLSSAIPPRSGLSFRFRMPYYLIPGDLLLLSPMYFSDPAKYTRLAVTASNGGVLGLQSGYATRIGRFQFVLGREIGITWYGTERTQQLLAPPAQPGGPARVVNFKSIDFDMPIVEYRPYRAFSANQSSSLRLQVFVAADVPYDHSVASPQGAAPAHLDTVWSLGLRLAFDWRYYWSGTSDGG